MTSEVWCCVSEWVVPDGSKDCSAHIFKIVQSLALKIIALWLFEIWLYTHPMTECHIPEDLNLQEKFGFWNEILELEFCNKIKTQNYTWISFAVYMKISSST
jgi:hypothetical protein